MARWEYHTDIFQHETNGFGFTPDGKVFEFGEVGVWDAGRTRWIGVGHSPLLIELQQQKGRLLAAVPHYIQSVK